MLFHSLVCFLYLLVYSVDSTHECKMNHLQHFVCGNLGHRVNNLLWTLVQITNKTCLQWITFRGYIFDLDSKQSKVRLVRFLSKMLFLWFSSYWIRWIRSWFIKECTFILSIPLCIQLQISTEPTEPTFRAYWLFVIISWSILWLHFLLVRLVVLLSLWCRRIWFFRFTLCANVLSQWSHFILRLTSCTRICLLRSDELVKPFKNDKEHY